MVVNKLIFKSLLVLSFFLGITATHSQSQERVFSKLEGYWEGAFIKNNSYQKFEVQFYKKDTAYTSLQIMEEWHPQFGEFVLPFTIDSTGIISTNTGKGKAFLNLDSKNLELIGYIEGAVPPISIHLKKVPPPPKPNFTIEEITVKNKKVKLNGHLHVPDNRNGTALIIVGGRSCYAGNTKYDLYAKLLRRYGISVLSFNKRGTGKSTGDCALATIEDLASDVSAIKRYLENHPNQYKSIGVLGSSAGGWVMAKAQEKSNFDFMIGVVGPSTSVEEQQMQSMAYGFDFYQLSESARANLLEYTRMMFEAKATQKNYEKFSMLLDKVGKEDWKKLLDDTDIPADASGINDLWVRRHNYDPAKVFSKFNNPFLAIYGEIDWIVPYKENVAELEQFFDGDRKKLLTNVVVHNAEHGTEVKGDYIKLTNNKSYWHFYRISPEVSISIIDFLVNNGFIKNQ